MASNCRAERSFSCLRRIKNYLRSKLSQENLNSFAVLTIECGIAKSLDYDEIMNQFADQKSRMKTL